jgi:hypothetical protein
VEYPRPPSAASSGAFDFWWSYSRGAAGVNICAANWAGVRAYLGTDDATTHRELITTLEQLERLQPGQGWAALAGTMRADLAASRWSRTGVRLAIWDALYRGHGQRLDAIALDAGAVLPAWNAAPGAPAGLVCWNPATQVAPQGLSASALAAARAESKYAIRLAPGEAPPLLPEDLPSGFAGPGLWAALAIGLGLLGWSVFKAPKG